MASDFKSDHRSKQVPGSPPKVWSSWQPRDACDRQQDRDAREREWSSKGSPEENIVRAIFDGKHQKKKYYHYLILAHGREVRVDIDRRHVSFKNKIFYLYVCKQ